MTKKIAYSYCRFSRPEQLKGDSLRRQKEASQAWCEKNGYTLDDSLKLDDKGLSAFRGDNILRGKLRAFIDAVDQGKVRKGSVLIVESLDRISRQAVGTALTMFIDLLGKGIEIVTLNPEEHFSTESINETVKLIVVIVILSRAYEESAIKSHRLKQAWLNKRKNLQETGKPITGRTPSWITLHDGAFTLNENAATVRRIVAMYLDNLGVVAMAKKLNTDNVPRLGSGKQTSKIWQKSTILKILRNRALIGEFQPHLGKSNQDQSHRESVGDPIENYFPPLISEADFYRVQSRLAQQTTRGRTGNGAGSVSNLFQGLIFDARDSSCMNMIMKGKKAAGKQLVSSYARSGKGEYRAVSYQAIETALLSLMRSIKTEDILPSTDHAEKNRQLEKLIGSLGKNQHKINRINKQLEDEDGAMIEALFPLLKKLTTKKNEIEAEINRLEAELHNSLPTVSETVDLVSCVNDSDLNRRRFRQLFRQLVERVDLLVLVDGHWRQAFLRLRFFNQKVRTIVANTHRANLMSMAAYDADYPITSPETQQYLQQRLSQLKDRSVEQTAKNLEDQLLSAAVGLSGTIKLNSTSVIDHHTD